MWLIDSSTIACLLSHIDSQLGSISTKCSPSSIYLYSFLLGVHTCMRFISSSKGILHYTSMYKYSLWIKQEVMSLIKLVNLITYIIMWLYIVLHTLWKKIWSKFQNSPYVFWLFCRLTLYFEKLYHIFLIFYFCFNLLLFISYTFQLLLRSMTLLILLFFTYITWNYFIIRFFLLFLFFW